MSFTAIVKFYGKEEGGRYTPPRSGYKPQLRIGEEYTSCIIQPRDKTVNIMEFGVEYPVEMKLLFEKIYKARLSKNMTIELYEGSKLIGTGIITDI